jgi:signal transduction histidine kinase
MGAGATGLSALLALPASAAAAGPGAGPGAMGLLGMAAALLALAALAYLWHRLAELKASHGADAERAAGLLAIASAGPAAFYCWSRPDGREAHSANLPAMLGKAAGGTVNFRYLCAELDRASARALDDAVTALRGAGTGFTLTVTSADGSRRFEASGARIEGESGRVGVDTVWLQDVSRIHAAFLEEARRAEALARDGGALRALLDGIAMPVWRRDASLRIVECNRAYVGAVEASSAAEAIAESRELASGAIGKRGTALAEQALASGAAQRTKVHAVMGGSRRFLEIAEVPLPDGGTLGYAVDQTELEALRGEFDRHIAAQADVLEKLGTAIAIYGPDQRVSFFNAAYARLWGLDEDWLRGQPTMGEVLEAQRERRRLPEHADFPAFKRTRLQMFTSLIEPYEELQYLPDGTTLRTVITPHPFGGLLLTFEDVTDKLTLERNYNTLIAVQRETIDTLHEAIAVFGGDLRLKLYNPSFARMWGLPGDGQAAERHLADLLEEIRGFFEREGNWEAFKSEFIANVSDRTPQGGRLERSDGAVLDWAKVPLPDGAVVLSYLDVTDSIRVERALRERNEALITADRLKSEFIANVSYELRTPLNAIIGFAEILNNQYFGELNSKQVEYTRGILDASNRLLSLINDILDLALIEAGRMTLEREPVQVHALLVSVMSLTREWGRKQNLTFEFDCPPDIGTILADERRLKQALFNLVSNAIKFSPSGGRITLSAAREGGELVLAVTDTGIGIPQEDQARVFEKFERGRGGGAGLGLSLVRSFVDLHGGRVEIDSEPTRGTTVRCYLPLQGAEAADPAREAGGRTAGAA